MDGEGKIEKIVSREYPIYFPHPGWSEQNPEDWDLGELNSLLLPVIPLGKITLENHPAAKKMS